MGRDGLVYRRLDRQRVMRSRSWAAQDPYSMNVEEGATEESDDRLNKEPISIIFLSNGC
jgi:hypothetical protein